MCLFVFKSEFSTTTSVILSLLVIARVVSVASAVDMMLNIKNLFS